MYIRNSGNTQKERELRWKGKGQVKKDFRKSVLKDAQLIDISSIS